METLLLMTLLSHATTDVEIFLNFKLGIYDTILYFAASDLKIDMMC